MKHLLPALLLSLNLLAAEPALILPGADGKDHTPLAVGGKKAAVLFFVSPYCPTSNTFVPEMNRIIADYGSAFAFYLVHSDRDQKLTDILQHTEMNAIKAPVLLDKEQRLARLAHAKITPEAAVIAADGTRCIKAASTTSISGPPSASGRPPPRTCGMPWTPFRRARPCQWPRSRP